MGLWARIKDAFAEEIGEAEEKIHRPLYPIKHYVATVSEQLSRGSWPSKQALADASACGFRSIVNLCSERENNKDVSAAGLTPYNIRFRDNTIPSVNQVSIFLDIVDERGPVLVHCEQGIGRTGCMVAAYRVLAQGWTPKLALKEAESFGLSLESQRNFILGLKKE